MQSNGCPKKGILRPANYFLIILISSLLLACNSNNTHKDELIAVYGMTIKNEPLIETHTITAEITPRYKTILSFRVDGKVVQRNVENGQHIKKGQTIAILDIKDFELSVLVAKEKVNIAKSAADKALIDERRYKTLLDRGVVNAEEYDLQKSEADAATAQLALANNELKMAQDSQSYTTLVAPFDGIISNVEFEVGEVVNKGHPLAVIYDDKHMEVLADIPETLVSDLSSYEAKIILWNRPKEQFLVTLREVSPFAAEQTKTFEAQYSINNSNTLNIQLLKGMTARLILTKKTKELYSILPATALVKTNGKPGVWEYIPPKKAIRFVPVTIYQYTLDKVVVSGLKDGMVIIVLGGHKLDTNAQVRIKIISPSDTNE